MSVEAAGSNIDDDDEEENADTPAVKDVRRWDKGGTRQPVWANSHVAALKRQFVPITIFLPGVKGEKYLSEWEAAIQDSEDHQLLSVALAKRVTELRHRVAGYDIPFLSLNAETSRETALDVFIKMNTSTSPLRDFDFVVAQLESEASESLLGMIEELIDEIPLVRDYKKREDIILSVAALLMEKQPGRKTYRDRDFSAELLDIWEKLKHGLRCGIRFLQDERIFLNEKCLPSEIAAYLVCALWADVPEGALDLGGNARALIRKVLWRANYTDRYSKSTSSRAFTDYKVLKRMVAGEEAEPCELFNERSYPLPDVEQLKLAGWPKQNSRLPCSILATGLRRGGQDFADAAPISVDNIRNREYHHLYPVRILGGDRDDDHVNRALNCALITWKTNRNIRAKTPKEYIEERRQAASIDEDAVRRRLESHGVPYDALIAGNYDEFLEKRAELIGEDMKVLCEGRTPS